MLYYCVNVLYKYNMNLYNLDNEIPSVRLNAVCWSSFKCESMPAGVTILTGDHNSI